MSTLDLRRIPVVSDQAHSPFLHTLESLGMRRVFGPEDLLRIDFDQQGLVVAEATPSVLASLVQLPLSGPGLPIILGTHPSQGTIPSGLRMRTLVEIRSDGSSDEVKTAVTEALEVLEREQAVRKLVTSVDEGLAKLNEGQAAVLEHLLRGCSNKQVAEKLGVGLRTVEARRARCMEVLRAASFAEMVGEVTLHHYHTGRLPRRAWRLMPDDESEALESNG